MELLTDQISKLSIPSNNEIEVTTIGVGGFEGESIIVHFGNGKWGIIDSCKSNDGQNLPLLYLNTLKVPLSEVAIVVCTHWHSDHINGLHEVLQDCPNARFYYPAVGQKNNLLKYLLLGDKAQGKSSVWTEFLNCLKTAGEKRTNYGFLDRIVYDQGNGTQLIALSPSDKMLDEMHKVLAKFDVKDSDLTKINETIITPNMCSTALILSTPDTCILLGADLEANRNKSRDIRACVGDCNARWEKGWCNVIKKSATFPTKHSTYFKLPHHSSKTGYCEEVWNNHIDTPSISVSTVFVNNAGVKLPQKDMLVLYRGLSSEMYLTSTGPKKKDKSGKGKSKLDQNKSDKLKSLAVMNEEKGIICSRKMPGAEWITKLLGTAVQVNDSFIKQYQDS